MTVTRYFHWLPSTMKNCSQPKSKTLSPGCFGCSHFLSNIIRVEYLKPNSPMHSAAWRKCEGPSSGRKVQDSPWNRRNPLNGWHRWTWDHLYSFAVLTSAPLCNLRPLSFPVTMSTVKVTLPWENHRAAYLDRTQLLTCFKGMWLKNPPISKHWHFHKSVDIYQTPQNNSIVW